MHPALVAILVLAFALLVIAARSKLAAWRKPSAPVPLPRQPSIHRQIVEQRSESPNTPLDGGRIETDDPDREEGIHFAPGALDALLGGDDEGAEWKRLLDLIRRLARGEPLDWTALDAVTAELPARRHVDRLLGELLTSDLTSTVRQRFWEVATQSRRRESVKWGIAIGGVGLQRTELEPLLVLAEHAEFTLYAVHVLMREGANEPLFRRKLVELLPRTKQWGVIRVIDYIVAVPELIADRDVQRDVLIYGMENHEGIPMEVAFTIAKSIDVEHFVRASRVDERTWRAVCELMETLTLHPNPLGGLRDLPGWEKVYHAWIEVLEHREADVVVLAALRVVRLFLDDDMPWSRKARERERIERLWEQKFSSDALRRGLDVERDRWLTLQIIREQSARELLPDVRRAHAKHPDISTMEVLTALGDETDLEALRVWIGSFVDLEARARIPRSTTNVVDPGYERSVAYAQVVRAMARLATPAAVVTIKSALTDFEPSVRAAGCDAVAQLNGELVDTEIRAAVQTCANESPKYLAEAARAAAAAHGIPS